MALRLFIILINSNGLVGCIKTYQQHPMPPKTAPKIQIKKEFTTETLLDAVLEGLDIESPGEDEDEDKDDIDFQKNVSKSSPEEDNEDDEPVGSVLINEDSSTVAVHSKELIDPKKAGKIIWQNKDFDPPNSAWLHDTSEAEAASAVDDSTPLQLLGKYFTEDIYKLLADQTYQRYLKKKGKELKITSSELKQFLGTCIQMGNLHNTQGCICTGNQALEYPALLIP